MKGPLSGLCDLLSFRGRVWRSVIRWLQHSCGSGRLGRFTNDIFTPLKSTVGNESEQLNSYHKDREGIIQCSLPGGYLAVYDHRVVSLHDSITVRGHLCT